MINNELLQNVLISYKKIFFDRWKDEKFKLIAIKHFQDNWDIKAKDFAFMLKESLSKVNELLTSAQYYPRGMICGFSEKAPEEVRSMFIDLFDEGKDVFERIEAFKNKSSVLLEKYGDGAANHYQTENAICTYLWLRYPDKYYIYKFSEVKSLAETVGFDEKIKKGDIKNNLVKFKKLYDEVHNEISKDTELLSMYHQEITNDCYSDSNYITLTIDLGHYVNKQMNNVEPNNKYWIYAAGPQSSYWDEFYKDGIMAIGWNFLGDASKLSKEEISKKMKEYYNDASSHSNDVYAVYQFVNEIHDGDIIFVKKGSHDFVGKGIVTSSYEYDKNKKYYHIRKVNWVENGLWSDNDNTTVQKTLTDITSYTDYVKHLNELFSKDSNEENTFTDYDSLKSNATFKKWLSPVIVSLRELGGSASLQEVYEKIIELYDISDEELSALTNTGVPKVKNDIAWARNYLVYEGILDSNSPRGVWTLTSVGEKIIISDKLAEMIVAKWLKILQAKKANKEIPIIDLTPFYEYIEEDSVKYESYTKKEFLDEVYMTSSEYDTLVGLLRNKKNIILQGAPGVGKTFAAERLAYSMIGEKDPSRINFIQFHQNYSYEDFIMGYKPSENGFVLTNGIFYKACINAKNHSDKDYYFIIDEINRGNMSKIFGELLMLIESDKRGKELTLAYSGTTFGVPSNLYIIGMMNTADRSLALIDYALRRFSFYEMTPGFNTEGFKEYQKSLSNETFDALIEQVIELNNSIRRDSSLGKGFEIGHSYFCGKTKETCTEEWMKSVVNYDIIPMLEEYYFDDTQKELTLSNRLIEVFNG